MKIIVIGAGLIGVSTAFFLNQEGHEVVVLDRQTGPGMDTSFANGGMITPSQAEPWNHPGILWKVLTWVGNEDSPFLLRPRALTSIAGWGISFIRNSSRNRFYLNMKKNAYLAAYSVSVLKELRQKYDIQYDANVNGTVKIFDNREDFEKVLEYSGLYKEMDIQYRLLDREEVIALEPSLQAMGTSLTAGIYYPGDESGDAHKFCRELALLAERNGVKFKYQVEVNSVEFSGNRVNSVKTSSGQYEADKYILAAGSYSTVLAATLKLKLPIQPVKGYSLTIDINGLDNKPVLPVIDESRHLALVPLGSRLRVAGTAELDGYDMNIAPQRIENIYNHLGRVYPQIIETIDKNSVLRWTGLRPYTADGVPVIGPTCYENMYLNTGHGHLGWSMAAGSGRLISDLICARQPAIDPSAYQLDR